MIGRFNSRLVGREVWPELHRYRLVSCRFLPNSKLMNQGLLRDLSLKRYLQLFYTKSECMSDVFRG